MINSSISNLKEEAVISFLDGYDTGLENSLRTVFDQTENCGKSFILVDNYSKFLIDENCAGYYNDLRLTP